MLKDIRGEFRLISKECLLLVGAVQIGVWAFMEALLGWLGAAVGEDVSVAMGGVIAGGAGLFALGLYALIQFGVNFTMALSMGRTRRACFVSKAAVLLAMSACSAALTYALSWASEALRLTVYHGSGLNASFFIVHEYTFAWLAAHVVVIGLCALYGAVMQRFGRTGFWVVYMLIFLPMAASGPILSAVFDEDGMLYPVGRAVLVMGPASIGVGLLLAAAVLGGAAWGVLRRTSVRI